MANTQRLSVWRGDAEDELHMPAGKSHAIYGANSDRSPVASGINIGGVREGSNYALPPLPFPSSEDESTMSFRTSIAT